MSKKFTSFGSAEEALIKAVGEYAISKHGKPDDEVKGVLCDIVCAGGCAAICAISGAIATAVGSASGKSLASKYL